MAEKDPNRLKGASCTATLDVDAKTLTFEHWGFGSSAEQKSLSPAVVPLGAISSVEFEKRWYGSWLYVALRGQQPWLHGVRTNPHGLTCGDDPTPFAEALRAAVSSVEPLGEDEWEPAEAPETPEAPPSWRRRFAKGAAVAVVNGFFNTR
jgi:hypothetical protein